MTDGMGTRGVRGPLRARTWLLGLLVIGVSGAGAGELPPDLEFVDIPGVERDGELVAREVSGCAWHQGRMWVVDNEDDRNLLVMTPAGELQPRPLPAGAAISDLEGLTSDGTHLYLMAGGGLGKKRRLDPRRFVMVRLSVDGGKPAQAVTLDMLPWLDRLARDEDLPLEEARGPDGPVDVIEDVKPEGLAMLPDGRLLVGLRKPLVEERSLVVSLEGYREAFDHGDPDRLRPAVVARLDLEGAGVSSLEHDRVAGGILVLAIHPGELRSDLWFRAGEDLEHLGKLRGHKAEGVARLGRSPTLLVLADDEDEDGTKMGRYVRVDWTR